MQPINSFSDLLRSVLQRKKPVSAKPAETNEDDNDMGLELERSITDERGCDEELELLAREDAKREEDRLAEEQRQREIIAANAREAERQQNIQQGSQKGKKPVRYEIFDLEKAKQTHEAKALMERRAKERERNKGRDDDFELGL